MSDSPLISCRSFIVAFAVLFALGGTAPAQASPLVLASGSAASSKAKRKAAEKKQAAKKKRSAKKARKKRRRGKRRASYFRGHGVSKDKLRTEPLPKPSGNIWLYAPNFREEVRVNIYDKNGALNEGALAELDTEFRCKNTNEVRAVDPRLYQVLSIITDHFGGKRVELISGFRFQKNEGSRHYHASAMDLRIPGVSERELYEFAESLDTGGMGIGIYPRSGFVHVDFRAPGDPSYRWVDRSPSGSGTKGGSPSRRSRRTPGA